MRRAVRNVTANANETWSRIRFGRDNCAVEGIEVVCVLDRLRMPAVGIKTLTNVLGVERKRGVALDSDMVIVVKVDEFAEPQMACKRGRLRRDAFHKIAV